ncbi:MAG: hypothetical protein H7330_05345, partial [Hymenobacteraceae bacterium]|nr:hypothetical protein [Hymenobacteraceae bacterium]
MRYLYLLPLRLRHFRRLGLAALSLLLLLPLGAATAQPAPFTLTGSAPRGLSLWGDQLELSFSRPLGPATWGGIDVFVAGKHAINTKG